MADKLIIVMANTDPADAVGVATVLFQAGIAAAMEYEVELILTGRAARLACRGVAAALEVPGSDGSNAYDYLCDALQAGAVLKVCTTALEQCGDSLLEEVSETVGAAYLISEAMNEDTVTFTY
ncbi:peroxiredoxin [Thiohalobacter sp. IOR34]|uniref:peroxiredoxin n=1 Tax=Thiohalobacter sp. IOR34 TaxID=3057176 RepID=UPI0025AF037F|nr:peroxiredoxin [Thiohalobacter sp. IOR34]WJW76756.1 peroxiredoxin [Thiohalobacter sp. IOR34]